MIAFAIIRLAGYLMENLAKLIHSQRFDVRAAKIDSNSVIHMQFLDFDRLILPISSPLVPSL
jgi:hypothetical protein